MVRAARIVTGWTFLDMEYASLLTSAGVASGGPTKTPRRATSCISSRPVRHAAQCSAAGHAWACLISAVGFIRPNMVFKP